MNRPDEVRRHFLSQGEACEKLGSPFTAKLCRVLADNLETVSKTGNRVLNWSGSPRADALALRLCGGLHQLVLFKRDSALQGVYPPNSRSTQMLAAAVTNAINRHDDFLCNGLDSAPQTNEIGRSAILLPGFETIARLSGLPLELNEVGSSAGLNLLPEHYRYRYGSVEWGDDSFPETLEPNVEGSPPLPNGDLAVASRRGCDLFPVNIEELADRERLKSYIWPDQIRRMARLEAALAVAGVAEFKVERLDAETFVAERLSQRKSGGAFVLFHSIMWQYLDERTRRNITSLISAAGKASSSADPVYWLRMENAAPGRGAELRLISWPGGEEQLLAQCDFHGRWIKWIADQTASI